MFNFNSVPPSRSPKESSSEDKVEQERKNPPPDDAFKRLSRHPTKGDTERATAQRQEKAPSSLFDLSRTKPKTKTTTSKQEGTSLSENEGLEEPLSNQKEGGEEIGEREGEKKTELPPKKSVADEKGGLEESGLEEEVGKEFETEEKPTLENKSDAAKESEETRQAPVLRRKNSDSGESGQEGFAQEGEEQFLQTQPLKPEKKEAAQQTPSSPPLEERESFELPPYVRQLLKEVAPQPKESSSGKMIEGQASLLAQVNQKEVTTGKEAKSSPPAAKKESSKGQTLSSSSSTLQEGMAPVNAALQGVGSSSEKAVFDETQESSTKATIKELAKQLVETIQVMKKEGVTETIVTLRNPPLLAGATITLTEYDQAKGEFNLRFANLTQQGKTFLDGHLSQESLNKHMEEKGIVVHIVTTSTEPEKVFSPISDVHQSSKGRDHSSDQEKKREEKNKEKDEEEES